MGINCDKQLLEFDVANSVVRVFKHNTKKPILMFDLKQALRWLVSSGIVASLTEEKKTETEVVEDPNTISPEAMAEAYIQYGTEVAGSVPCFIEPGGRYWKSMTAAGKICGRFKLDPYDFVRRMTEELSEAFSDKGTRGTVLPWPNQLGGKSADMWIARSLAKAKKITKSNAVALAKKNEGVALRDDKHYQAIREKCKLREHTADDIEYCRLRQIEMNGQEAKWLAEFSLGGEKAPKK